MQISASLHSDTKESQNEVRYQLRDHRRARGNVSFLDKCQILMKQRFGVAIRIRETDSFSFFIAGPSDHVQATDDQNASNNAAHAEEEVCSLDKLHSLYCARSAQSVNNNS